MDRGWSVWSWERPVVCCLARGYIGQSSWLFPWRTQTRNSSALALSLRHTMLPPCILMDSSFIRSDLISHWPVSNLYPVLFKSSGKSVARILHSCKFSNIGYFLFYTSLLGIHVLHFPDWDFCKYTPKIPQQLFKSTCFHLFGQTELLLDRGKLDACHNVQFVAESRRSGLGRSEVLIIIHI